MHIYQNNSNGHRLSANSTAGLPEKGHIGAQSWHSPIPVSRLQTCVCGLLCISVIAISWHRGEYVYCLLARLLLVDAKVNNMSPYGVVMDSKIEHRRAVMTIRIFSFDLLALGNSWSHSIISSLHLCFPIWLEKPNYNSQGHRSDGLWSGTRNTQQYSTPL